MAGQGTEMKKHVFLLFVLVEIFFHAVSSPATPKEIHSFSTPAQQMLFENLTQNLRCLVCQNQSLADSDAGLAKDLRNEIYQLIIQGNNEEQIKNYLTVRYGKFILFKPPLSASTFILWFGPFILLLFGLLFMYSFVRGKNTQ